MHTLAPTISNASVARLPGVSLSWSDRPAAGLERSGVALFVGFVAALPARARSSRADAAIDLDRWEDWGSRIGAPAPGFLDYAVKGFFENGGARCWVWPLALAADASVADMRERLLACFEPGSPLEDLAEPDLVCIPDASLGALADHQGAALDIQQAALAHCHRMNDRMALLDCMPGRPAPSAGVARHPHARVARLAAARLTTPPTANGATPGGPLAQAANGAVYWPWLVVSAMPRHGIGATGTFVVPPCGHVAGMIARLDTSAGRHKAPANESLAGAWDVDERTTDDALAQLNDEGVNCLRVLVGRGVCVCGARTLSDLPPWRYINVRRVVLGLARWAELGLRDLVMETNEPALWERVRQRVSAWCLARHREGVLRGDSPDEAYFVKCDAETNPPDAREVGQVVCEIGLAATVPAEFIVLQLIQSADGAVLAD